MEVNELLRVVALRRGRLNLAEFKLREGEKGLSLFARVSHPHPDIVREAVRSIGKQGVLGVAVLSVAQVHASGLSLVKTQGGTLVAEVDAIHYEARLPLWRQIILRLQGRSPHEYFNEQISSKLHAFARLLI